MTDNASSRSEGQQAEAPRKGYLTLHAVELVAIQEAAALGSVCVQIHVTAARRTRGTVSKEYTGPR